MSRPEKPVFGFAFNVKVVSARVVRKGSISSSRIHLPLSSHPEYHITLEVDGRKEKTSRMDEKKLSWDETFNFQGTNMSKVRLGLVQRDKKFDKTLGDISIDMIKLAEYDGGAINEVELVKSSSAKSEKWCYVKITVSILREASIAATIYQTVARAADQAGAMNKLALPEGYVPSTDGVVMIGQDAWPMLMGRLSALVKIVDRVSEVHPYAKLAWDVTSVAYKLIRDQIDRDARINHLITCIWEAYEFVDAAEPLKTVEKLQTQIQALAHHTVEASYFVRDYSKFASFGTRVLISIASDVDGRIQGFENTFSKIQLALQQRITLESALTVKRISAKVEQIADDIAFLVLDKMRFHYGARYDPALGSSLALPSKTVDLLSQWINSPRTDVPRLWLVTGDDRSQLSALASTICVMFDKQNRLASSFFCCNDAEPTHPHHVFATIGRNLADYDDNFKLNLYSALRKQNSLCGTKFSEEQFSAFLVGPLKSCEAHWENQVGPSVVVVNSLDLCGDVSSRGRLLAVLFGKINELPSNIRILVTSSPSSDIIGAFKTQVAHPPLVWTRLSDNDPLLGKSALISNDSHPWLLLSESGSDVVQTISATLSSLRTLSAQYCVEPWGGVQMRMKAAIDSLSQLESKLTLVFDTYAGKSRSLLLPLETVKKAVEVIQKHASTEPALADHLESALDRVSAAIFLVHTLSRNDIDTKGTEHVLKRIDDLLNEVGSSIAPNSTVVHAIRLVADPHLRSCHPMFFDDLTCQLSSRSNVIRPVLKWASNTTNDDAPRVFLLFGQPGSGKTSIAHSVTRDLMKNGVLAWSFFHEICGKAECGQHVFSSASKCLAGLQGTDFDEISLPPPSIVEQLKSFCATAVQYGKLGITGPVVLVFDGLDRIFSPSVMKELVSVLETEVQLLPLNFRLFFTFTSGTEDLVLSSHSVIHFKMTCNGTISTGAVPNEATDDGLDYAQELFEFMDEQRSPELQGRDPLKYVDDVMTTLGGDYRVADAFLSLASKKQLSADMLSLGRPADLDELYTLELQHFFQDYSEDNLFEFRLVMAICKMANEKAVIGLDFFHAIPFPDYTESDRTPSTWLAELSGVCILHVGSQKLVHVKKSFKDFLFNPAKEHRFSKTGDEYQPYMVYMCIFVMCRQIEAVVQDSSATGTDFPSLKYACLEWSRHLRGIPMRPLPNYFWGQLNYFLIDFVAKWVQVLQQWGLTPVAVRRTQDLVEWLLTRLDVDTNDSVTCSWRHLVCYGGLDSVRDTLQEVDMEFERTIKRAESALEPRMGYYFRRDLSEYRSRRPPSTMT